VGGAHRYIATVRFPHPSCGADIISALSPPRPAANPAASVDFFACRSIASSSRKTRCKVKKSRECHATGDLAFDLPPIVASRNRQWRRSTVQSDKAIGFDVIQDSPVPTNITPELILDVVELQPTHRRLLLTPICYTDPIYSLDLHLWLGSPPKVRRSIPQITLITGNCIAVHG
jgi:hypothetical protein